VREEGIFSYIRIKICYKIFLIAITIVWILLISGCSYLKKNSNIDEEKQNKKVVESKYIEEEAENDEEEFSKSAASYNEDLYAEEVLNIRPEIDYLKLSNSTYNSISALLKSKKNISDIEWSNDESQVVFAVYDEYAYSGKAFMYIWKVGMSEPYEVDAPKDRYCNFFWSPDDKYIVADTGTSVIRKGYIISVKSLENIDQIEYVFNVLWSADSNSIILGKRREMKTRVATELEGTVDIVNYDFINKEEKIIAEGSHNSYCVPVEWREDGSIIYTVGYFDNHLEEEHSYLIIGSDFSMSLKLEEIYNKFSKDKDEELLSALEPQDICKLYFHAEDKGDYETMYALYYSEDDYFVPTLDGFLKDMANDSVGRQNSRKFLRSLRRDIQTIEIYTGEKEAKIVFTFKNMNPDENKKGFTLLKSNNGIWKVRYLPMQ